MADFPAAAAAYVTPRERVRAGQGGAQGVASVEAWRVGAVIDSA